MTKHHTFVLDEDDTELFADTAPNSGLTLIDPQSVEVPDHPFDIYSNEYGFYSVPQSFRKREVPSILRAGQVYEADTLKFMQRVVGDGDLVSGGAFVGDFFPALSRALAPGAVLHSFEPNPISYRSAAHTIALNKLTNVSMSIAAVGEEAGVLPLQVARAGGNDLAAGAKLVRQADGDHTINVDVVMLDMLIPADRNVTVLHLDIEGHEMPALLGARQLIQRCKPIIILEGIKPSILRTYKRFLRNRFPELNYRHAGFIERNMIFMAQV